MSEIETMLLTVRHETNYGYDKAAGQLVQILRLTPGGHDGQEVLDWRVTCSDAGAMSPFVDGLGNQCHLISERGPVESFSIVAEGRVRTRDLEGVVAGAVETMPPAYFLRQTPLTSPSEAIVSLAKETVKGARDRFALFDLMSAIHERVAYVSGETHAETTAAEAFEAGAGVCQDQAHIYVAAARALGAPARYVGGYVWEGEADGSDSERPFASHAWAEAWAEDVGWIGFDPSNGVWVTTAHVRVAIGLDYRQAAPISGRRRGVGQETLDVRGRIHAAESGQ